MESSHGEPSDPVRGHRRRPVPRAVGAPGHPPVPPLRSLLGRPGGLVRRRRRLPHGAHRLHPLPAARHVGRVLRAPPARVPARPDGLLLRHGPALGGPAAPDGPGQLGRAPDGPQRGAVRAPGPPLRRLPGMGRPAQPRDRLRRLAGHRAHPVHRQLGPRALPVPGGRHQRSHHQHGRHRRGHRHRGPDPAPGRKRRPPRGAPRRGPPRHARAPSAGHGAGWRPLDVGVPARHGLRGRSSRGADPSGGRPRLRGVNEVEHGEVRTRAGPSSVPWSGPVTG